MDRLDIFCHLGPLSQQELEEKALPWPTQVKQGNGIQTNHSPPISAAAKQFLHTAQKRLGLSVRGFESTLRVASTIARLDGAPRVDEPQVAEALQYAGKLSSTYWLDLHVPGQILFSHFQNH